MIRKVLLAVVLVLLTITVFAQRKHSQQRRAELTVTAAQFDRYVDTALHLLRTKALTAISDSGHVVIMMCLNTIPMSWDSAGNRYFTGGRYEVLESLARQKDYYRNIIRVYPDWYPNKGMGYYFPKLRMELGGTPGECARFKVRP